MKKSVVAVVCVVFAVGAVTGGFEIYTHQKNKKAVAEVAKVSMMEQSYWEDDIQLNGYIAEGNVQKINPDNQKLVEEVLVSVGDEVKKGDSILKYDQTALQLNLQEKENAVAMAEVNIQNAEKELKKYKSLKPSELAPSYDIDDGGDADDEPESEENSDSSHDNSQAVVIADFSSASSGTGTAEDPYIFVCNENTTVAAILLSQMRINSYSACFTVVPTSGNQPYQWVVNGSNIPDSGLADWKPSSNVSYDSTGNIAVDFSGTIMGTFKVLQSADIPASDSDVIDNSEDISDEAQSSDDLAENMSVFGNNGASVKTLTNFITTNQNYSIERLSSTEDYVYSRAELTKMISEKQDEIKELEISKKSAELEYKTAKTQSETGTIIATIDGVVSEINEDHGEDEPYITIKSTEGLTIKGTIGEFSLDKIEIGSVITIQSWDTGETTDATVTEIDDEPDPVSYYNGIDNPNSSMYEFTAQTSADTNIDVGSGISISIPSSTESDTGMYIPKAYVREDNGMYYVMMADENNLLKKQYITTGKIVYGYLIEIKDGLTEDDRICFPYGKNVKEGVRTKDTDTVVF